MAPIRIVFTVLLAVQTAIVAYLGVVGESAPMEWKAILVALSAGLMVAVNQIPRWQDNPPDDRINWTGNLSAPAAPTAPAASAPVVVSKPSAPTAATAATTPPSLKVVQPTDRPRQP